jgi:indolepyruvate ferredoxin oxidoreductase
MIDGFLSVWDGDEETKVQFSTRLYDLFIWGGSSYAKEYLTRVLATLRKDSKAAGFAVTKAVIKYLHKVMEIKDEIYVAHLLTNPEKYQEDARRYKLNLQRGDRIRYNHINRPHFDIMGLEVEFDLNSRDWMLKIMKRMGFARVLMPSWHKRERAFRNWYGALVDKFSFRDQAEYDRWLTALSVPEDVKGFRSIRYPKMESARAKADSILADGQELKGKESIAVK